MKDTKAGGFVAKLGDWAVGCDKEEMVIKLIDINKGKAPGFDSKAENFKAFSALSASLSHGLVKAVVAWSVLKSAKAPIPVVGNAAAFGLDLESGVSVVADFPPASIDATKAQLDALLKKAKDQADAMVKQLSSSPQAAKMKPMIDRVSKLVAALQVKKSGSTLRLDVPIKASDVLSSLMPLMALMK